MYGMSNNNVNNISRPFCGTWGGFKYFVVRLVNGTCCIYVQLCIGCYRLGHIFGRFWAPSSYLISLSDELSLVSHSLCGFFTWLAYALDHMYRIGLRNSVWIRFHCRKLLYDNGDIYTTTCCTPDVLCVLMFYQRFVGLLTFVSFPWQCVFKLLFLAKVH